MEEKDLLLFELIKSLEDYFRIGAVLSDSMLYTLELLKDITFEKNGKTEAELKAGLYLISGEHQEIGKPSTTKKSRKVTNIKAYGVNISFPMLVIYICMTMPISDETRLLFQRYDDLQIKDKANEGKPYAEMPTSPALKAIMQSLINMGSDNKNKSELDLGKNYTLSQEQDGNGLTINATSKNNSLKISFEDLNLYKSKNNKGLLKLFILSIIKANEQNFPEVVSFNLQDMVDFNGTGKGICSSVESARLVLKEELPKLRGIGIDGTIKRGKKTAKGAGGSIFYHYMLEDNTVKLWLDQQLNIKIIAEFFSIIPNFAFYLPAKSFNLLWYIFFLARQNTDEIRDKGYFNISLEAIKNFLALPDDRRATQFIKKPIEEAIDFINQEGEKDHIKLEIISPDDKTVKDWLKGYVRVNIEGYYKEYYLNIAEKREKKTIENKKRLERAKEKALVKSISENKGKNEE